MSQKIKLNKEGELFNWALHTCLKWLAIGGEIVTKSEHKILMTESGEPGFWATSQKGSGPKEEILFQIGSDTVWMYLVRHAMQMTEENVIAMCADLAFNS